LGSFLILFYIVHPPLVSINSDIEGQDWVITEVWDKCLDWLEFTGDEDWGDLGKGVPLLEDLG
jgi:hypothetical protein